MRDLTRQAYLSDNDWKVLRFTAVQVLHRPWEVAARVRYELVQAARRQGTVDRCSCTDRRPHCRSGSPPCVAHC